MKQVFIIIVLFFFASKVYSQATQPEKKFFEFDTTRVKAPTLDQFKNTDKIIVINYRDAIIYLSNDSVKAIAEKGLLNDFTKQDCEEVLRFLDSSFNKKDTVYGIRGMPYYFNNIVSKQLRSGNARVYDKKRTFFVAAVYHRMERVISDGDRKFYLENGKMIFSYHEIYGIMPNEPE